MSCPPSFRLELKPELDRHPLPHPPVYLKHQVYDKPDVYAKIDSHAVEISKQEYPSFKHLMWNLVFCHKFSDLERARVIFRWMTSKNLMKMTFDNASTESPDEILLSFRQNRISFARIYEIMCTYAGLHCVAISGYAKGVDYLPGDRFQGLPANHSWNAVFLNGSWQLIDAQWATRYLSAGAQLHDNVVYEYDDFYFLMEPQQAVYSHFPEDCRWQLLPKQLTLAQFESLPLTKSQFFKCGMDFRGEHHGVVQAVDGCIRMTLGFWKPGAFTYKLQHLLGSANDPQPALLAARSTDLVDSFLVGHEKTPLKDFVLQETTPDALNFFFRLPTRGVFYLTIYALDLSNAVMAKNGTFRAACEHKIIFSEGEPTCEPYPACDSMNWGPSWLHTRHYGLELSHPSGVISLPAGRLSPNGRHVEPGHLKIHCARRRPEVQLFAKMKRNADRKSQALDQCHKIHLSEGAATFELDLPEPGEYGYDIYANEPEDGRAFTHVCQYLVHYEAPPDWFPRAASAIGGSQAANQRAVSTAEVRLAAPNKSPNRESLVRLREMVPYGTEAPSIGQLPQLYLEPQLTSVQSKINEDSTRQTPRVFSPSAFNAESNYQVHPEFRYAPTTWSDTEYLERGFGAMDPNGDKTKESPVTASKEAYTTEAKYEKADSVKSSTELCKPLQVDITEQMRRSQPYMVALVSGRSPELRSTTRDTSQSFSTTATTSQVASPNSRKPSDFGQTKEPSVFGVESGRGSGQLHQSQYNRIGVAQQQQPGTTTSHIYRSGPQLHAAWVTGPLQKEPPKEFVPQLLDPEPAYQKPAPDALPDKSPAYPMQSDDPFKAFQQVDEHAMAVSYQEQNSFNQLIWQLIYARNITSDLDRVRAIFLWLCTKDLHQMNFNNVVPGSPEEILMGIRTGKSTYAQIFQILCRYANLHCKLLLGYAKGADYSPGMRFGGGGAGQHSWNAVLVDGTWRLVDCHWAARRLIVKRASVENVRYILDTFYFLANPSQLIYTHFPHDKDWQLLHHPISLEDFETLPLVKSAFFKYNLSLATHRTAVILFAKPEITVVVGFPKGAENTFMFTVGLTFDDKDSGEHYNNISLMRFTRQEVLPDDSCVAFYIRPPRPGAYKLLVYAKQRDGGGGDAGSSGDDVKAGSVGSGGAGEPNMYGAVCEYRMVAKTPTNTCLPPFPPCQTGNYGPTEMFRRFDLTPLTRDNSLQARGGIAEVRFALPQQHHGNRSRPLPRIMGRLRCSLLPESDLERCILHRAVKNHSEAVVTVFLPDAGEFGLEVYANDPERDGSSYYAIWQYLITSEVASGARGLPDLPPTYLGPAARFHELGLSVVSHPDPFIEAGSGELCIQFNSRPEMPLKMMAQLIYASNNSSDDCSNMILQQMRVGQVFFLARIPRLGFYKLQLFALPEGDRNDSLPGVYNYLIESAHNTHRLRGQIMPFPQQFAHWRRGGCYLDTPTEGILGLGPNGRLMSSPPAELPFTLAIPSAHTVAVVVDEDWTYLERRGDRWEGSVPMKNHWGCQSRLAVCACYSPDDANFSTLLEYTLATP